MKIFQLRWGESEVNVINENSIIMHERREKIRREYVYKLRLFLLNCNALSSLHIEYVRSYSACARFFNEASSVVLTKRTRLQDLNSFSFL